MTVVMEDMYVGRILRCCGLTGIVPVEPAVSHDDALAATASSSETGSSHGGNTASRETGASCGTKGQTDGLMTPILVAPTVRRCDWLRSRDPSPCGQVGVAAR